jgi:beta-lactamase regulating signal transducer with metallopeptidase domain/thiol-disulfide isomerase/thioredoxin
MVQRLGWALLHSVWQVLAIAISLALVLPLVRKRSAHAAYLVCCAALLLTGLAPAITFSLLPSGSRAGAVAREIGASPSAIVLTEKPPAIPEMLHNEPAAAGRLAPSTVDRVAAAPLQTRSLPVAPSPAGSVNDRVLTLGRELLVIVSVCLPWFVLFWATGVLALSFCNVGGWLSVQRMKSSATEPISGTIQESAGRIARKLGLTRAVRLAQSAIVDSPIVIGVIKPVILLPACLIAELPPDQWESILAHELAHVLRQDYLVNLLQSAIETLLFYHPAVWWISSQVRIERENCCDDIAVGLVSDRATYVKALAAVAGARAPAMAPAATGGLLLPRLRRILGMTDPRSAHPSRWLAGAVLLSLCAGVAAFVAIDARSARAQTDAPKSRAQSKSQESATEPTKESTKPPPASKPPIPAKRPQAATKGSMQINVVDVAGEPIPDAHLLVSVWTDEPFKPTRDYTCDSQGKATIELPKTLTILRLWAFKSGYSGLFVNMDAQQQQPKELVIPDTFAFRLPQGTIMGGIVKNENGQPIEGVRVMARYDSGGIKLDDPFHHTLDGTAVTDTEGRWKLDTVPPGDDVEVRLELSHGDYISDQPWFKLQKANKITRQVLRGQTAAIVLQRGISVTGKVTDPAGKPIENAVVIWGEQPYWQQGSQEVLTNPEGVYRFPPLPAGPMRVTVAAEGWRPDSKEIELAPQNPPTDFSLQPGKHLRIRFVDRSGAPIPDVYVSIQRWRGAESLYNEKHPNVVDVKIPRSANSDGVFEWSWAPDDAVTYRFGKAGFAETRTSITASENEYVQTMNPLLRVTGSVQDAVTGKPIDKFTAVPIIYFRPDFPFLDRQHAVRKKGSQLSIDFDRTDIEHGVQVEAPGYVTFRTPDQYRIGDVVSDLAIRLEPIARYTGRVVNHAGSPVVDARVYVATGFQHLDLNDLKDRSGEFTSNYHVNTTEDGLFEIVPQIERYALVVVAPDGYAEVQLDASQKPGEIRIEPWASVSGKLVQSGKAIPNCPVMIDPIRYVGGDEPRINARFQSVTGDDGSFAFERVPPTRCRVRGSLHFSRESPLSSSRSLPLHLKPGERARVTLGGNGADVTGQLAVENAPAGFDYHFSISYLVAKRAGIEPPESLAAKSFDWRKGWSDSWMNTQEGGAYLETLDNWFVKPEPDGRFAISGVEPGDYEFAVHLYGTTEGCLVHPAATRVIGITVKPGQTQLDLGKLVIPSLPLPQVGDLASDFDFVGHDGATTRLSKLRGQYVLLDFWATWCGPCVAKVDEVERIRKQFSVDNRLTVVGVNLDADILRAKEFLKNKSLPWHHALLGDWSNTDVPRRYAISSIPAYVLVDPDGRILAQEYSVEKIVAKLKGLGENQTDRPKLGK